MADEQKNPGNFRKSGDKVTVACKLPHGLILRLFDMVPIEEQTQGGTRSTKRAQPLDEVVHIKGYLTDQKGKTFQHPAMRPEFVTTPNVDKEFFDRWMRENKDSDVVKNKLIFAHATDAAGEAREHKHSKNGFEPIDTARMDPRVKQADGTGQAA
jgi:hypothetical protein